jgi:hypothetical protein
MRHQLWGVLVAAVGILGAAGLSSRAAEASHTREPDRTSIIVRTYTQPASAGAIPAARRTASAILERAGIQVVWFECALPGDVTPADACTKPPRWNELLVRIIPAGALDYRPLDVDTLGFAVIDRKAGTGSLATVYADRVSMLAQGADVDEAELLGRTMAHEVGHLLLGTNRHTARGLMRGSWSSADLRWTNPAQWLFGSNESEAMRSGIAGRFRS